MLRFLLVQLIVCCLGVETLYADGPSTIQSAQRTTAMERQLDEPLDWKAKERTHVTLSELIDFIRKEHKLHVRWDISALRLIHSDDSPVAQMAPTWIGGRVCGPMYAAQHFGSSPYDGMLGPVVQLPVQGSPNVAPSPSPQPQYGLPYGLPSTSTLQASLSAPGDKTAPPTPSLKAPTPLVPAGAKAAAPTPTSNAPPPLDPAGAKAAAPTPTYKASPTTPTPPTLTPMEQKAGEATPAAKQESGIDVRIAEYLEQPISLAAISLDRATVGEALNQLLGEVAVDVASLPFEAGLPVTTRAFELTLMVDGGSVLITTRLRANATKETRVYRLGRLADMPQESLTRVITHTVRPWSWRGHADEIADRLVSRWPNAAIPLPGIELSMTEGIKLASAESAAQPNAVPDVTKENIAATGQLLAGGAAATMHSIVAACEIVHHGDPPTGVIESLPGMLIITQSQAAHREIRELLSELAQTE